MIAREWSARVRALFCAAASPSRRRDFSSYHLRLRSGLGQAEAGSSRLHRAASPDLNPASIKRSRSGAALSLSYPPHLLPSPLFLPRSTTFSSALFSLTRCSLLSSLLRLSSSRFWLTVATAADTARAEVSWQLPPVQVAFSDATDSSSLSALTDRIRLRRTGSCHGRRREEEGGESRRLAQGGLLPQPVRQRE